MDEETETATETAEERRPLPDSARDATGARRGTGTPGPGQNIGRYVVLDLLGAGGMGVVYAAYDPELDRRVALKLLQAGGSAKNELRLLREAQAMARLNHPNVAAVHDVGTIDGQVFIAMEFVQGKALNEWLETEHSVETVLSVMVQAGHGLAAAHAAGLIHRDFKPSNVMLGDDGRARVLDFGLARTLDELEADADPTVRQADILSTPLTQTGAVMGTPAYMAPEQHLAEPTDARTDQFAFCVATWEALFGTRPFSGKSRELLCAQVLEGKIEDPPKEPKVPERTVAALRRGLARRPEDRYADMDALLGVLAPETAQERRGRSTALALGTMAVAAAGIGYFTLQPQTQQLCTDGAAQIDDAWNEQLRDQVRGAFAAVERPYAQHQLRQVEAGLDAYRANWSASFKDACEATRVRGEQSERLMDRRMSCLRRRAQEFGALSRLLSTADEALVQRSADAVAGLPRLESCADVDALARDVPPPDDLTLRGRVEKLQAILAETSALRGADRHEDALALIDPLQAEVNQLDYDPLRAEYLELRGDLLRLVGRNDESVDSLYEAINAAARGGDDHAAARAWIMLVGVVGFNQQKHDEALLIAHAAEAAVLRIGDDPEARSALLSKTGLILDTKGDHEAGLEAHQRALELRERLYGPDSYEAGVSLNNLALSYEALGELAKAREVHERALNVREQTLGPDHPFVAVSLGNLGWVLNELGEPKAAVAAWQRALTIMKAAHDPDHPDVGRAEHDLGLGYMISDDYEQALVHFDIAIENWSKAYGPEHPWVASIVNNAGISLLTLERYAEAREYQERALKARVAALGEDHVEVGRSYTNLAEISRLEKKYDEALELYEKARVTKEKALGPEHPGNASTLVGLGLTFNELGRYDEAASNLERGLELQKKASEDHPDMGQTLMGLAITRLGQKRDSEAVEAARSAVETFERYERELDAARAKFVLARALRATQPRDPKATDLAREARDVLQREHEADEVAQIDAWL